MEKDKQFKICFISFIGAFLFTILMTSVILYLKNFTSFFDKDETYYGYIYVRFSSDVSYDDIEALLEDINGSLDSDDIEELLEYINSGLDSEEIEQRHSCYVIEVSKRSYDRIKNLVVYVKSHTFILDADIYPLITPYV